MAHYLITGGAGFIGSHLADVLVANGHVVRVLDNLSTGRIENLPCGTELIRADILNQDAMRSALDGIDGCFHLAAIASVEQCRRDWRRSHAVNLTGLIALFEELLQVKRGRAGPVPVVYASSAAVYGAAISEQAPTQPLNAYGVDKLGCEMHAAVGAQLHGLASVGLRFFNVYGPRQDPNSPYSGVVSVFSRRIRQAGPVEIHGDGSQVRDFLYVADAVAALRRAMDIATPGASEIFNVCTGVGTRIRELAETLSQIHDAPFAPRSAPSRAGDIKVSIGDPRKASRTLGFTAQISLKQGLIRTFISNRGGPEHLPGVGQ
jgi:UDP-glucose 4-epimerase